MSAGTRASGPRRTTPTACASSPPRWTRSRRRSRARHSSTRSPPGGSGRPRMRLELGTFPVHELAFGPATRYESGRLTVDRDAALAVVREDPRIATAELEIARPGESVRIWPVRDVIEPRVKVEGPGVCYPGICGRDIATVGEGRTHRLAGMGVVEVSSVNWHDAGGDYVETYLDMSGPYGQMYPYQKLVNLCLVVEPDATLNEEVKNYAVHKAALTVADQLGEAVRSLTPTEREVFE